MNEVIIEILLGLLIGSSFLNVWHINYLHKRLDALTTTVYILLKETGIGDKIIKEGEDFLKELEKEKKD